MNEIAQIVAIIAAVAGTLFSVVGVLGFIRLPDVYSRLHATGKVAVYGVVLLLIATVAWTPVAVGRGLLLIILLMVAGPVTSHVIASAAHRIGVAMKAQTRNDLDGTG